MLDIFLYAGRAIMPLLLMMALGCGLRRAGRWSDDFYRQLNGFCFHVLLPVQLFLNVYAIEDLSVLNWRLLGFIVACIVGAAGLGVAVAPLFARDRGQRAVIAQATFRANQVIMGIPLASALGGEEALIFASLVTSVCVPVFNVLAVLVLEAVKGDYYNVFLCVLTLVLFMIPTFVEHRLHIDVPNTLEIIILLFIFSAEILGEIQEYYLLFPFWDTMLHTINGFLISSTAPGSLRCGSPRPLWLWWPFASP